MFPDSNPREFQKSLDYDECRRTRDDNRLQFRRGFREMQFQKKRRMLSSITTNNTDIHIHNNNNNTNNNAMILSITDINNNTNNNPTTTEKTTNNTSSSTSPYNINARAIEIVSNLPSYVRACMSDDIKLQFEGAHNIRLILSIANDPPIQLIMNSGVVPRLVYFLSNPNYLEFIDLQFECIWSLTNILSGKIEFSREIIANGVISILIQLLKTQTDLKIQEQIIWCLSNIGGDSLESRDLILSSNVFPEFEKRCRPALNQTSMQISILRIVTWAIANCLRGCPPPDWEIVKIGIRSLNVMLTCNDDSEILADACWGFAHLTALKIEDQHPLQMQSIRNIGALKKIIDLLGNESFRVRIPALRVAGNVVSADTFSQVALNLGLLQKLVPLLEDSSSDIRRECCWTLSNIAAGNEYEIQQLLNENLIPILINLLKNDLFTIKKEVIWILCNITVKGNDKQISYLVEQQVIQPLCAFLYQLDCYSVVCAIVDGMENILRIGGKQCMTGDCSMNNNVLCTESKNINMYAKYIEEYGGVRNMELLLADENLPSVLDGKISKLIKEYFSDNDIIVESEIVRSASGTGCLTSMSALSNAQKAYLETQLIGIPNIEQAFNKLHNGDDDDYIGGTLDMNMNMNMNGNKNNTNLKFNF